MIDTVVKAGALRRLVAQEDLNFLLTNRIPRIALTRLMGRISRIDSPAFTRVGLAVWQLFTDLDLSEAEPKRWRSLHEVFTRALVEGARPIDPDPRVLTSPCDAIVGECGVADRDRVFQAKGSPYSMRDLFGPSQDTSPFEGGTMVTLRLTSAMYHRFHAPDAGRIDHVTYLAGDTWNVNPVALARIERLFCRNERAVLRMTLADGAPIALVPVAAVLVASLRLHFADVRLHLRWKGPNEIACSAAVTRGEELGWFEHGSTILVFAPPGFSLAPGVASGGRVRMGQALLLRPPGSVGPTSPPGRAPSSA
jgi:phosphatidylserine decarboxylase